MVTRSEVLAFMYPTASPAYQWAFDATGKLSFWDTALGPQPTDADIAAATPAAQVDYDIRIADYQAGKQDVDTLRAVVATAVTRLIQIRDAPAPTNPQVVQAVRDMAGYMIQMVKALSRKL